MSESSFSPLLRGAIDLHVHAAPSQFPRIQNVRELAADATAADMSGFVIKAHEWATGPLAAAVQAYEPDLRIFGGIVLNPMAGGLSPQVVEAQLQCAATKLIWMPTIAAKAHQTSDFAHGPTKLFAGNAVATGREPGMTILDAAGTLRPEVHDILELIAQYDRILCSGHLSPREVDVLVDAAIEHKISKILIQHVDVGIVPIPLEQQYRLAAKGAMLEKCLLACTDFGTNNVGYDRMAAGINEIGAASCVLVTDFGQAHNLPPIRGLSDFATAMLENGVTEAAIRTMLVDNPRQLLGL